MVSPEVLQRLQMARTPKAKKLPIPIAKQSERKKKEQKDEKALFAADKDFYAEVWNSSPHVCEECGRNLGKEPLTLFFHHVLPKRQYPEFRHTHENIMILCPDCHTQAETDIDKTPKVKARTAEVTNILIP